ncbi:MAG: hypothetical protein WBM08_14560 [Prochlorococcaceae cyanobacterium]
MPEVVIAAKLEFNNPRLASLVRFGMRALQVSASTVAVVELFRQEWVASSLFALAWLLALQAQRTLNESPEPPA